VTGQLEAELGQTCVVTLEPVPAHLSEAFKVVFAPGLRGETGEITVSAEDEDPPEPLTGNEIDVGEVVVQQMGVSLDPYPRSPHAPLPQTGPAESGAEADHASPFAKLEVLKRSG
jgi:uncharacterized metal-binding protein YceD (DUF177 family)